MPLFLSKRATIFLLKTHVLFYITFLKRTLHITISSEKVKKYLHDTDTKYYIENVCHQFLDLQINLYRWIHSSYILYEKFNKILQEPDWSFVTFWNLKSLCFTCSHSFSFVVPLPVIRCHSLSFVITRCHSLSHVVTRCYSLSLVVPLVVYVSLIFASINTILKR